MSTERATAQLLEKLPTLDAADLEGLVRHHNRKYWDENAPEIDDTAFDVLVEALRKKSPTSPVLDELGATLDRRFAPVEHERKMLSLDKCYDDETFAKWFAKFDGGVTVTPKIDGIACGIRYDAQGEMILAATRGDGRTGDNISNNVANMASIPKRLKKAPGMPVEVRGEVYMSLRRFRDAYEKDFANPRNLTAGALKHKEPKKTATYDLQFFAYDLAGTDARTEREKSDALQSFGFTPAPMQYFQEQASVLTAYAEIAEARASYDYELDGVVMKVDDVATQDSMGLTAHHPRYAIAYKFASQGAETSLIEVQWSVGRTGAITPVAIVAPVVVSGVTVQRASLHNLRMLRALNLTRGATVEVVRRGDVIPHIERVIKDGKEAVKVPSTCPSCQGPTKVMSDFLHCAKPSSCPTVVRSRIKHFLKSIDVNGFGEKHLTQLIENDFVKDASDMFRLTHDDLVSLDRLGEKSATKLMRELNAKRRLELPTFLAALGIEEVGYTVAETICDEIYSWEELRAASEDRLGSIHGIGPSIAESIVRTLKDESSLIESLLSSIQLVSREKAEVPSEGAFVGKSVVFTGKLKTLSRKPAQERVKSAGGKTPSSVSSQLDFLVIGDDGSPLLGEGKKSTKHTKAEKLNADGARIQIISETDFIKLFG